MRTSPGGIARPLSPGGRPSRQSSTLLNELLLPLRAERFNCRFFGTFRTRGCRTAGMQANGRHDRKSIEVTVSPENMTIDNVIRWVNGHRQRRSRRSGKRRESS